MPLWTKDNCENMYPCWSYKEKRDYRGRIFNIHLSELVRGEDVPLHCNGSSILREGAYADVGDLESRCDTKEFTVRQAFKQVEDHTKAMDLGVGVTIELPVQLKQVQTKALAQQIIKAFETDRPVLWAIHGNKQVHPHLHILIPSMGGEWTSEGADGWKVDPRSAVIFSQPGEWGKFLTMVARLTNDLLETSKLVGDWFPGGNKNQCDLAESERAEYEKEQKVAKEALGDFLSEWGAETAENVA